MALVMAAVLVLAGPGLAAGPLQAGVEIGGVFGRATASANELTSTTIELDLAVEADANSTVVAHLIDPGGAQETLPLPSRGAGVFGIRTEVRKIDYVVVFEAIEGSLASQSQPLRLTELGADPETLGVLTVPPTDTEDISDSTRQWGWAGLGLAAGALTLLALWALPDRRKRAREAEEAAEAERAADAEQAAEETRVETETPQEAETAAKAETSEPTGPREP